MSSSGWIAVSDSANNRIRTVSSSGEVTTLAGGGSADWVDGVGTAASFSGPLALAVDTSDNIYVSDSGNSRIRWISTSGEYKFVGKNGCV